nr:zinc dependent phospholipase C family protein [Hufsiella ginkgonis]
MAVFTLPSALMGFYKNNIDFITEHAVDPDKRRYTDSLEAPRHYLDADHYGTAPFDSIPQKWADAVKKYGEKELMGYGTVPWEIQRKYYALVKAFSEGDTSRILKVSSDIGHYIADAHVPLHTTENYNGQMTGQTGIHAFWESRLPELFADEYDYYVGRAHYIQDPLKEAFKILKHTFGYKDSVLVIEARLSKSFPTDRKYTFVERSGKITRQYSTAYSRAFHNALNGMVEEQMRASILHVGSFWYSAWVDAGQPDLRKARAGSLTDEERKRERVAEEGYRKGGIIGREY